MFKLKYLSLVALLLCLFFACKKQSLLTYHSPNTIYFADSSGIVFLDTATMSFAYSDSTVQDSSFGIGIYITGGPSTSDRVYSVAADPTSSAVAGRDYVLPDSCVFHANHVKDTLYIKFLRSTALQDSTFHLIVDLKANQNFQINMPFLYDEDGDTVSAISFKVALNDILTSGPYWSGIFQPFFGVFSVKKVKLMNQIVGLPLDFWVTDTYYTSAQAVTYAINMARYLDAQTAAGNTIYDTDGLPMTMGVNYQ